MANRFFHKRKCFTVKILRLNAQSIWFTELDKNLCFQEFGQKNKKTVLCCSPLHIPVSEHRFALFGLIWQLCDLQALARFDHFGVDGEIGG